MAPGLGWAGGKGFGMYGIIGVPCSIGPGFMEAFELGEGSIGW